MKIETEKLLPVGSDALVLPLPGFTPGPWSCGGVHKEADHVNVWMGIVHIAAVMDGLPANQSAEANARLIAAAPTMLAALRGVIRAWGGHMSDDGCGCADCEYLRPVEAAIREASGQNSLIEQHAAFVLQMQHAV